MLLFPGPQYSVSTGTSNIDLEGQWNALET